MEHSLPTRPRNLTAEVVEVLTRDIKEGRLRHGDKLPTEAAIMAQFGVSRTVVREAISKLQAAGLVQTRHGIGTFVLPPMDQPSFRIDPAQLSTLRDVIDLIEFRIGLETEAAALAAQRRSPVQLEAMRSAMQQFGEAVDVGTNAVAADFAFHSAIARATQNPHYIDVLQSLGAGAFPRARLQADEPLDDSRQAYLRRVNQEHENIFNAIATQDAEAARAAMRTHLSGSRDRLKKGESGHS
jgi:DNA-binding FadR family transcriptional regulator